MNTIIDVKQILRSKLKDRAGMIPAAVVNYLVRTVHQDELNEILTVYRDLDGIDFMTALVEDYFRVTLTLRHEENLPDRDDGRKYIFVSNHPLGGFDGICLSYLLGRRYGGRVRCLVNDMLLFIPNLRSIFVPINKVGTQNREIAGLTNEAFRSDNHIITFPAGLCSRKHRGVIRDLEWKKSFVQKAVEYGRDVVPLYFEGRNSDFFYRLANFRKLICLKMNLEMLYLPDELFRLKDKSFEIYVGKPVRHETFDRSLKPAEWAERMKETVYKLREK
ncbi:MAG: 1-acyl-sn-glycerol-3-phosphate acyltransferase [Tannerella sp.]|jgi:putative hemolysin|nr:1-acyl-sn-glycerol-3-phosphate acyltransferase [Tannerella sp.]